MRDERDGVSRCLCSMPLRNAARWKAMGLRVHAGCSSNRSQLSLPMGVAPWSYTPGVRLVRVLLLEEELAGHLRAIDVLVSAHREQSQARVRASDVATEDGG